MRHLLLSLLLPTAAVGWTLGGMPKGGATMRSTPSATMVAVPPEFPADVARMVASSSDVADAASGAGDMMLIAPYFAIGFLGASLFLNSNSDSGESKAAADKDDAPIKASPFGWLHADLRVPLPEWDELQHTCHLIGSEEKHLMYLCATPSGDGFTECLPSTDFSAYYGHDVYICKGGPPPRDLVAARE